MVEPRMRPATLSLLLLLGTAACTQEIDAGDPACAFDETGCVPSKLVIEVHSDTESPTAVLQASSPTESWSREGVLGEIGDLLEDEPGRIAPRVELSLTGDTELADLRILRVRSGADLEIVEQLQIDRDPRVVRLDNGERYLLEVSLGSPDGVFSFLTVVP